MTPFPIPKVSFSHRVWRLLPGAALLCALAIGGCSSGGSGGGAAAIQNNNTATIRGVTVNPDVDGTSIRFHLSSDDSHPMAIRVEYSEDRGESFAVATILDATALERLTTDPTGTEHSTLWDPREDLGTTDQSDLQVRLIPTDLVTLVEGAPAYSNIFGLGTNTLPVIESVTTPTTVQGGDIALSYSVRDAQSDHVGIAIEFSLDGGNIWQAGTPAVGGDGHEAVPTNGVAEARTVLWAAQTDAPNFVSNTTLVRLTALDVAVGAATSTGAFSVNLLAPRIDSLSIAEIPEGMNGSESYTTSNGTEVEFHLQIARGETVVTLELSQHVSGGAIDPNSLRVTADQDLGERLAGEDLGSYFTTTSSAASWRIPAELAPPVGWVTFSATIGDVYGNRSESSSLEIECVQPDNFQRPFEIMDRWFLNFDSDLYSITFEGGNIVEITSSLGGNGRADFMEDLEILGLFTSQPTAACEALGTNTILYDLTRAEVLGRVRELYGGSFDGQDPGYSSNLTFTSVAGGHRSTLRVGGDDSVSGFTLGRAHFDHRNSAANSNSSANLGVFTTNMIEYYINTSSTFKFRFDALIPGRGTPVGEGPVDHIVLDPSFERLSGTNTVDENVRYDQIWTGIEALGRSVAVIAAHEVGHSLGLCSNGPPPGGLFGGVIGPSWSGGLTNSFHFDSPGANVMAAALGFASSVTSGANAYKFNEINSAYLQEILILD